MSSDTFHYLAVVLSVHVLLRQCVLYEHGRIEARVNMKYYFNVLMFLNVFDVLLNRR